MIEAYRQLADVDRPPAAPRRHRGRPAAAGAREGHRRHRHAARRGHRRHDPLLAHRRSGRGGEGRARSCSRRWACASARASTSSRARRAAAPRSTSSRSAEAAQSALDGMNIPLQVAVMGCVVNGPGEARDADLGIAAGRQRGHLFVKGEVVARRARGRDGRRRSSSWAEFIREDGSEAALAQADPNAAAEAADRSRRAARRAGRRRQRERGSASS